MHHFFKSEKQWLDKNTGHDIGGASNIPSILKSMFQKQNTLIFIIGFQECLSLASRTVL
jgi:hypothetical protein